MLAFAAAGPAVAQATSPAASGAIESATPRSGPQSAAPGAGQAVGNESAAAAAPPQGAEGPQERADVVVTATRTGATGFAAPTPTTVVSADLLARKQVVNIGDALNELPAFKGTNSAASTGIRSPAPGAVQADLRGLGAPRTLVLVDGVRPVPLAPANKQGYGIAPDLNDVPTIMIDRVEVVTGGASAQWGSDAVAGVVNILLRTKFSGVEATAQSGISARGDAATHRAGVLAGTSFSDDRGHVVAAVDASDSQGLTGFGNRAWSRRDYQIVANPNGPTSANPNGLPAQILSPNVLSTISPGGLITGPANFSLRNNFFTPGGGLSPFQFGTLAGSVSMIGGQSFAIGSDSTLVAPVKRLSTYLHADYQVGGVTLFAEGNLALTRGETVILPARDAALSISVNNPFLPQQVATALRAQGLTSFTMNRFYYDEGTLDVVTDNTNKRLAVGAKGSFGGSWDWDLHVGAGDNRYRNHGYNDQIRANHGFAVNAVTSNGQIVCAATVVGTAAYNPAAAGCVPINLFGSGAPSAQAIGYVNGTAQLTDVYSQETAAFNVRGKPFSTWAGPVAIAAGFEYRHEKEKVGADAVAAVGGYQGDNATPFSGAFDVKEGYLEATVPLAKDMAFARDLQLDGAVRYASYSTVGDQTTWKGGVQYEPVAGLSFRGTRSRDIRAPALYELYSPGAATTNAVSGTINGTSYSVSNLRANLSVGNASLRPEKADTLTLGVVLRPRFLRGLNLSVDYYDIDLKGAITSYTAPSVANFCSAGIQTFCNYFTLTNGIPSALNVGVQNLSSIRTKGFEIAASYGLPLSRIGAGLPGDLRFEWNGTVVTHVLVNNGIGAVVDRAGDVTGQFGDPHFRWTLLSTYSIGGLSLSSQVNFISAGNIDNTFNTTPALTINNNRVPSRTYVNLRASYDVGRHFRIFGGVTNLLDKDPPPAPNANLYSPTSGVYYDLIGRSLTAGVTVRY